MPPPFAFGLDMKKLVAELTDEFIRFHRLANYVNVGKWLMSEAAYEEFEGQDVFGTLEDFVGAMPPGIRGLHAIPMKVGVRKLTANSPESELFRTVTYVNPTEESFEDRHPIDDASIYRVDDAGSLPKDQSIQELNEQNARIGPPSFNTIDESAKHITDYPRDTTYIEEYNRGRRASCQCDDCECSSQPLKERSDYSGNMFESVWYKRGDPQY